MPNTAFKPTTNEPWAGAFSGCGAYRYLATMNEQEKGGVCWITLHPEAAGDYTYDTDRTLQRCARFTHAWGFKSLSLVNLFPLRGNTNNCKQWALSNVWDSLQPMRDNFDFLYGAASDADLVIAAWGSGSWFASTQARALERLNLMGIDVYSLGINPDGRPRHPLGDAADNPPPDAVHFKLFQRAGRD